MDESYEILTHTVAKIKKNNTLILSLCMHKMKYTFYLTNKMVHWFITDIKPKGYFIVK